MDKQTRQIIAFHVGDRSHESAQQLWANLPTVYREQAELILHVALDPAVASRARKGELVKCFDYFGILQTARN